MAKKQQEAKKSRIVEAYEWTLSRLERTIFMGIRFFQPKRFLNPHGFLGMLTFITFIILGITGVLLMFYYKPSLTSAYDSVKAINDDIEFGFILRNIHYHASNAMVFLALYHMFYQFFAGKYKLRNEVIWITGVLLGVLTVIEAYTGYDLILNERAVLAINIGASLTNSIPFIGPTLAQLLMGSGFSDIVIRFYVFHVFLIPVLMGILMLLHFPRNLILDLPMISVIAGGIIVTAGIFPVDLGAKFTPEVPPGITVPEWYLTSLYAFIRTGIDKFVAGVLAPTLFILLFLAIPFIDRKKAVHWSERPWVSGIGVAALGQIIVTTVWGFYVNPDPTIELAERLEIDPLPYYGTLIAVTLAAFALTLAASEWVKEKRKKRPRETPQTFKIRVSDKAATLGAIILIILQLVIAGLALQAYTAGQQQLALIEIGASLMIFGFLLHLLRFASSQGVSK